ncbi:MAG: hypothetical protein AAFP79_12285 [Pseudomonadota bacterium]
MTHGTDPDRLKNQFAAAGAREFVESGNAFEARSQFLASAIADDKDAPITLSASQQSKRDASLTETNKRRREEQQRIVLTLAEQAHRLSEQLGKQIAAMEHAFEAEMGDAWREQIANKVMDADDIPQRREGESMKDYRDRLKIVLITMMVDPETGEIKPEFTDNPETARYSEWAQAQHRKAMIDNASEAELVSLVDESKNWRGLQTTEDALVQKGRSSEKASTTMDQRFDAAADLDSEMSGFPSPGG